MNDYSELAHAAKAYMGCDKYTDEHNDCLGCPMPNKENPSYQKMCVGFEKEVLPKLVDALEALTAENERLREAQRWIPCSERLPEVEGEYECICVRKIRPARFKREKSGLCYWDVISNEIGSALWQVTHWRWPAPPQKGGRK